MRTFSRFTTDPRHTVPEPAFIMAQDERRAAELTRQELLATPDSVAIEIMENGRTVSVLRRDDAAASNVRSLEPRRRR